MPSRNSVVFIGALAACALIFTAAIFAALSPGLLAGLFSSSFSPKGNASFESQTTQSGPSVYSQLGYPVVTYDGSTPYSPADSNFSLMYRQTGLDFQVGSVEVPVINLTEAVSLAESAEDLSPANYTLVDAEFDHGTIVNGSVTQPAGWILGFARVYDGFWLYGLGDNYGASAFVDLDATTGSITDSGVSGRTGPTPGNYTLTVTASQALAVVRALGELQGYPPALTQAGHVTSISPRIIQFTGSDYSHLAPGLSGKYELCWRIAMSSSSPPGQEGSQGVFYVDGQNGSLSASSVGTTYPESNPGFVGASLVPSVRGASVQNESFQTNVDSAGLPKVVTVNVPDVIVMKTGSTGVIEVNFSSDLQNTFVASLSFSNPLPAIQALQGNGLPEGVQATFDNGTVELVGVANATRSVTISVSQDAPSGTYLLSLESGTPAYPNIIAPLQFFLTVWNGNGAWPSPPGLGQS